MSAIAPGGKARLRIKVRRFGKEKGPVTLTWKKRPAGLSAPDKFSVGAGADQVEVEVTAAPKRKPLRPFRFVILASTRIQGKEFTAESAPVVLPVVIRERRF